MTTMTTRKVRLSERKIGFVGQEYKDTFVGRKAVYTTWGGDHLVGTIEWSEGQYYPLVRFPNGTWARLDLTIDLVVE